MQKIRPCLWFDSQAKEAADLYVSIFPDSAIDDVSRYGTEGFEIHRQPAGTVLTVAFRLRGQKFLAFNGGPRFKFTEAISLEVDCETQEEVDHYWNSLIANGGAPSRCGWLKDKYGLSWQIIPTILGKPMSDKDKVKAGRVMNAMLQMSKLDVVALQRAYEG